MSVLGRYRAALKDGDLRPDAVQEAAAKKLDLLARTLKEKNGFSLFRKPAVPKGLYIWGDVGRGKTLLMDLFFDQVRLAKKRRAHFNAFMAETHARLHAERQREGSDDPIPPVARAIAAEAQLLCFDEFQVGDVADAMILGRLFDQLFNARVVIVATSNTAPDRLYEGGLNRQLFLPFIAEMKSRMEVVELSGATDYRLRLLSSLNTYFSPLGPAADAAMDAAWKRLTGMARGKATALEVLGRELVVPQAAGGVARFDFADLCARPLAAADYLAVAHNFHTLLVDHIPVLSPEMANEARRFVLLIDTLYDEGVRLICSAAAAPDALYPAGTGADSFRRAASRLAEMQSADYLQEHRLSSPTARQRIVGEDVSERASVKETDGGK